MPPKVHYAASIAVPFAAFFAAAAAVNLLPVQNAWVQTALFVAAPIAGFVAAQRLFRFVPARCPHCGGQAHVERGMRPTYLCLACRRVHDAVTGSSESV